MEIQVASRGPDNGPVLDAGYALGTSCRKTRDCCLHAPRDFPHLSHLSSYLLHSPSYIPSFLSCLLSALRRSTRLPPGSGIRVRGYIDSQLSAPRDSLGSNVITSGVRLHLNTNQKTSIAGPGKNHFEWSLSLVNIRFCENIVLLFCLLGHLFFLPPPPYPTPVSLQL